MSDLPKRPPSTPESDDSETLDQWRDRWRDFRDQIVEEVATLFDEHSEADPIATQLRRIGDRYAVDDKPWKLVVQARSPDTLNYRYEIDRRRRRQNIARQSDGQWWSEDRERPDDTESTEKLHRRLSRRIVSRLYWWGDLEFVGISIAVRSESFVGGG